MTRWLKALSFGAVSSLAIAVTYIWLPHDTEFAGAVLDWKLTVYLPMLALSLGCWVCAIYCFVGFLRRKEEKKEKIKIAVPVILFLPFLYELTCNVGLILRLQK